MLYIRNGVIDEDSGVSQATILEKAISAEETAAARG
jgi:hypothetical protein